MCIRDRIQNARVCWEDVTFAEDRSRVRSEIAAAIASGKRFSVQYRVVTSTGNLKWVLERGIAVADEQGRPVIEGFIEDFTVRHETLEALEMCIRDRDSPHRAH